MKYVDLENIWTVDLELLSKSDRGLVYFERAKRIIDETLANPVEFDKALKGKRFNRSYLVEKIECPRSVATQNPKIRQLLIDTDKKICKLLDQANA